MNNNNAGINSDNPAVIAVTRDRKDKILSRMQFADDTVAQLWAYNQLDTDSECESVTVYTDISDYETEIELYS